MVKAQQKAPQGGGSQQGAAPGAAQGASPQAAGRGNAAKAGQIGRAEDPAEAKADAVADQVVRRAAQDRGDGAAAPATGDGGGLVSAALIAAFDDVIGADVSGVRVAVGGEADRRAQQLGAAGFAEDGEAHLSSAAWRPGQASAEHLLAHELAHVALGHADAGQPTRLKRTGAAELKRGAEGPEVRHVQERLLALGFMSRRDFDTGPGIFGPRTEAAVSAFQASRKLGVDGVVGARTLAALNAGAGAAPVGTGGAGAGDRVESTALTGRPPIRIGSEGVIVKQLQRRLNRYGASLGLDGEFGAATDKAVKAFQRANGFTVDGIVGPTTAAALSGETAKAVPAKAAPATGGGEDSDGGGDPSAPTSAELDVDDADPKGILNSAKVNPTVRKMAAKTLQTLQGQGLSPYLFEGHRTMETQNALYAKGRTKPGSVVTYVKGGGSWHNYGLAVDIVFWNRSHSGPSWDAPSKHWQSLGKAGKAAGFTRWMGDSGWDFPHFEHHPKWGNTATNLLSTYNSGGLSAVWKKVM
jgi:peptidoglycan hydrolase-like protein with peptidoglycan-binding domain